MKLMVLDGNSLVNRAFFGIKLLTTKDGRYTNAIYGFQNILLNLLAAHKPDAVAIAWDERAPTFRHTAYDGYKATRHGMPEELAQQMPVLKELLTDLGFVQVSKAGWEADDILGTLAAACEAAGGTTLLATGDRDSLQLVDDATTVLLATNKETIPMDPAAIREKYGIEPPQLIDVKSLMGDASDNIPGVPGIGEKTALALISKFGSLQGVYEHLDDKAIKPKQREKLEANKELAELSHMLGTIRKDAPIETAPEHYCRTAGDPAAAAQLLAELDGFDPSKGIIVLGATNRPEVLDKALLRPGRFDRRITIDRPNLAGRLATLQVHTRKIKLSEDVDLKKIALATAGCVGADLANLVNEAALRAVRQGRRLVTQEDLLASFEFVIAGSEKKNSVLTEFEKKLVAYHEVGHAMVAYKQKNAEPVQKITIVPHTEGSLGYTLLMPEEDKTNLRTRDELMAKIAVSMGGRAAEEVVMNTMTNGASQDIQEATSIARNMVAMYGMSDAVGMVALGSVRNQYLDGGYGLDCAQDTAAIMDREVKRILDECYKDAVQVIRDNREDMDKVVAYLLEKETITGGEMVAILEGRDPSTVEEAYASTRKSEDGFRPSQPSVIEAPAKHISMTSEKIEMPPEDKGEDAQTEDKPSTEPETPDTSAENTDENK